MAEKKVRQVQQDKKREIQHSRGTLGTKIEESGHELKNTGSLCKALSSQQTGKWESRPANYMELEQPVRARKCIVPRIIQYTEVR